MTNAELEALFRSAFLPFAKAFATKPERVTLTLTFSTQEVAGTLGFAPEDHDALTGGSMTDVDIGRAFRVLSHWHDGRAAALVIEAKP